MVLTLVNSRFLAMVIARAFRRIVILVTLAATVQEWFAGVPFLVKVPSLEGSVAWSTLLRLITWCYKSTQIKNLPQFHLTNLLTHRFIHHTGSLTLILRFKPIRIAQASAIGKLSAHIPIRIVIPHRIITGARTRNLR